MAFEDVAPIILIAVSTVGLACILVAVFGGDSLGGNNNER